MKITLYFSLIFMVAASAFTQDKINVVTTLSTYADIAKKIGGDKAEVQYIVPGNQDAQFVHSTPRTYWLRLGQAILLRWHGCTRSLIWRTLHLRTQAGLWASPQTEIG